MYSYLDTEYFALFYARSFAIKREEEYFSKILVKTISNQIPLYIKALSTELFFRFKIFSTYEIAIIGFICINLGKEW